MSESMKRGLIVASALAVVGCRPAPAVEPLHDPFEGRPLAAAEADFVAAYARRHPVRATRLGLHAHDAELPSFDRAAVESQVAELQDWRQRLRGIDPSTLSQQRAYDHQILVHAIDTELIEFQDVRSFQRNPMLYNATVGAAVSSLIDRDFAPLSVRIAALIARLDKVPAFFDVARANLTDVPKLWAEMSVTLTRGTAAFLRDDLPPALEGQGLAGLDPAVVAAWQKAHARAIEATERFARWLQEDLVPRATGDYRLGKALFEHKLAAEEHVSLSIEELDALNEDAIARYQAWVERVAKEIDPSKPTEVVVAELVADHPPADELLDAAQDYVVQARDFIVERDLVTLPTKALPTIRPTPRYARTGFASMSTPGPFESKATDAYYNVTNIDPAWGADKQEQHLTYFNRPGLLGISVHEAMPGHFVQGLYRNASVGDARRVFQSSSMVEGWAHYCEQMMVDEGFGGGDPRVRLGQLRRALQRHARWYAGIALHVTGTPLDEVAKRFEKIAYFAPFPALRETRRGTYNPTYLYYALGRMQILELRDAYRTKIEAAGERFTLRDFHDRFLGLALPIALARDAMLREQAS